MRRAEWRMRADDPKTMLGWWWRGVLKSRFPYDLFVGGMIVAIPVASILQIVWPMGVLGVYAIALGYTTSLRPRDQLRWMLPVPAPPGQFRVSVTYSRGRLRTGSDEMALTVVDGWLYCEGVRSHFGVRPEDVWRLRTFSDGTAKLVLSDGSEVRMNGVPSEGRVALERWHTPDRWMEGEPTFPPARVHPQELARWSVWSTVGFTCICLPTLVASLLKVGADYGEIKIAFSMLAFGVHCFAWRKLLRLGDITINAQREELPATQALPRQEAAERTIGESRAEVRNSLAE